MMHLSTGVMMTCTFGVAPSTLVAVRPVFSTTPGANMMDFTPANVPPFGMCNTQSNPAVAAATATALGVPTPAPCVPLLPGPWIPGPVKTMVSMMPATNLMSTLMCAYGGVIKPVAPAQTIVMIQS